MSTTASRSSITLTDGAELSFVTAGDRQRPAIVLIHGFPSSANTFRDIIPVLAEVAYVVAPDLPAHGRSDVRTNTSFASHADAVSELLDHLHVGERFIYLHDYGTPVGLRIAMANPELVRGLIIQNANAHRSGFDSQWQDTLAFWAHPDRDNEAAATAHFNLDGRHDAFFDIAETVSWMQDLPRMEAHVLDGGHFLLETHAAPTATLIKDFVVRVNQSLARAT